MNKDGQILLSERPPPSKIFIWKQSLCLRKPAGDICLFFFVRAKEEEIFVMSHKVFKAVLLIYKNPNGFTLGLHDL